MCFSFFEGMEYLLTTAIEEGGVQSIVGRKRVFIIPYNLKNNEVITRN